MAGTKKFAIAAGVVVVIAAAAWFGGNHYAKTRVEKQINTYLAQHQMQDKVTWGSLDASILGTASMRDVKIIQKDDASRFFTIRRLQVHELDTGSDSKKVDFEFTGLADQTGASPVKAILAEKAGELGYDTLPLLDGRVKAMLNEKADTSDYDVTFKQQEVGNLEVVLKADRIAAVVDAFRNKGEELKVNPLLLISALNPVILREVKVNFDDGGIMPRIVAVQKGVAPVGGKPTPEQDALFERHMSQAREDCRRQSPAMGIEDAENVCTAVSRFMQNETPNLRVSATPNPPLQLMTFVMQSQMGNPQAIAKAVKQLNLKITN